MMMMMMRLCVHMYISDNDSEDESNNDLFLANTQLASSDKQNNNNERIIAEAKEVVPVYMKLVNAIKKLDTLYNEEAQKIVAEATRKANNSMTGRETIQPELLDFLNK